MSSSDGFEILKKWERQRTASLLLTAPQLFPQVRIVDLPVRVVGVSPTQLTLLRQDGPEEPAKVVDIDGAIFRSRVIRDPETDDPLETSVEIKLTTGKIVFLREILKPTEKT